MGHFFSGLKMKLYLLVAAVAAVFVIGVYYAGFTSGHQRCQKKITENNTQMQNEIIKIQGNINAETYRRGAADIRRRLYEKYTITE